MGGKKARQHYFVSREIQATIAILVVLALLGGIFLQTVTAGLSVYFGFETPFLGVFLTIGYITVIAILAILFSHRFVGPFKRLEYEMKIVSKGELDRRLTIRNRDDFHVRNFVAYVNEFIENFEEISREYSKLNSTVSSQLGDIIKKIEAGDYNPEEIKNTLKTLQKSIHEFRERW
ncbi:MAG: hypothetical protein HY878_00190 [Deltaproteobacteria bacterium]|nr:hypothetical protein [Deltaproteobacteria bacterium]